MGYGRSKRSMMPAERMVSSRGGGRGRSHSIRGIKGQINAWTMKTIAGESRRERGLTGRKGEKKLKRGWDRMLQISVRALVVNRLDKQSSLKEVLSWGKTTKRRVVPPKMSSLRRKKKASQEGDQANVEIPFPRNKER